MVFSVAILKGPWAKRPRDPPTKLRVAKVNIHKCASSCVFSIPTGISIQYRDVRSWQGGDHLDQGGLFLKVIQCIWVFGIHLINDIYFKKNDHDTSAELEDKQSIILHICCLPNTSSPTLNFPSLAPFIRITLANLDTSHAYSTEVSVLAIFTLVFLTLSWGAMLRIMARFSALSLSGRLRIKNRAPESLRWRTWVYIKPS
jgi:hypothetical protein